MILKLFQLRIYAMHAAFALLAKRGNRGILREARDEGRRKKYFYEIFFFFPRFAIRARLALWAKYRVRLAGLIKRLLYRLLQFILMHRSIPPAPRPPPG